MKLLFIQGGSRWKIDNKGNIYTDANFNQSIWNRYISYCDELTVILRREEAVYDVAEAMRRFNTFDTIKAKHIELKDVYRPVKNIINLSIRKKIKCTIEQAVKESDKVIIRSLGNIYTNSALKYARKYNKPYLIEVTGFAWESMWYHSFRGKCVALFKELSYRKLIKPSKYAIYVTNEALQKRYPCKGRMLGCSDVELPVISESVLQRRIEKINNQDEIIIGTAAFLDVGWKGQEYVIRAISELKKKGIHNFRYQLIGAGEGRDLKALVKKLDLETEVEFIGVLPHDEVFAWMDSIDIYVQSSFMEGLCRSLVEAMSRACPIVCSDVGGNYELASGECLFAKGNYKQLARILEEMQSKDKQIFEAKRGFEKAKEFNKELLDTKRNLFFKEFIEGK